jgi:hypothetical protein
VNRVPARRPSVVDRSAIDERTFHPDKPKTLAIPVASVFVFPHNVPMPRTYRYVGPAQIAKLAQSNSPRVPLRSSSELQQWRTTLPRPGRDEMITMTFVVLDDGLWIADRQSEHVACARGADVLSAGELTLGVNRRDEGVEVVAATNQSTGYCPEPESWGALAMALDGAGISHPGDFTTRMIFRRCPQCSATNIVKDEWFQCAVCKAALPAEWNFAD